MEPAMTGFSPRLTPRDSWEQVPIVVDSTSFGYVQPLSGGPPPPIRRPAK
jgi:hypothetical protein